MSNASSRFTASQFVELSQCLCILNDTGLGFLISAHIIIDTMLCYLTIVSLIHVHIFTKCKHANKIMSLNEFCSLVSPKESTKKKKINCHYQQTHLRREQSKHFQRLRLAVLLLHHQGALTLADEHRSAI